MHSTLQAELIDILARHHGELGTVLHLEAKVTGPQGAVTHGLIRSIEAAERRYSCELIELHHGSGVPVESDFFSVLPPDEEASSASIVVLAKATAVMKSDEAHPIRQDVFEAFAELDR